ncbi:hypothetical protein ACRS8P_29285 [Burkholderia cenocepacia]
MSKGPLCPFMKKACVQHDCMLYTHITMVNPQTGVNEDKWACSVALVPILLVENARQTRGAQAAVESMRNDVVERQDTLNRAVMLARAQQVREVEADAPERISDGRETKPQFGN